MSRFPLSTLDVVSWVMDRPDRPLDFTLIVHASRFPDAEALREGARSAMHRYPVTASTIDGAAWVRSPHVSPPEFAVRSASSDDAARETLQHFVDDVLDLRGQIPVRQLFITHSGGRASILATRFHHAAADGRSAAMWIGHQLDVAQGHVAPDTGNGVVGRVALRSRRRRRRAGRDRVADPLWRRPASPTRGRSWHTIQFDCDGLRRRVRDIGAFTYNDALAAIALESGIDWNRRHAVDAAAMGLWMPVDVRRLSRSGFGNGTSRIRVRTPFAVDEPFHIKCRRMHGAISSAIRSGEWAVPESAAAMRLPSWLMKPVLRRYLDRPWADVGSMAFSHLEHTDDWSDDVAVDGIECVGPLHRRHACAIYGVTRGGCTSLTFTYDPALLTPADVEDFAGMYEKRIPTAAQELTCAA